jgi:4-hydroxy-tetrahydrodipicolinate synthase
VIDGTLPALLTPFDAAAEVDLGLLDAHVDWLRDRGIRSLSPLGTTGEGASLSVEERIRVIDRLAGRGDVALVAGTGCNALAETVALSRHAVERGCALLVVPPWYYPPFDRGLEEYFVRLFGALPEGARVVLYHIPPLTRMPITDGLLRRLRDEFGPMLAGVKDSGGELDHTLAWLRDFRELLIYNGSDATAAEFYAAGGRATITMLANLFPDALERIHAGDASDQPFLRALRELVLSLPYISALKHLLHLVSGLPRSPVRPPLQDLDDAQTTALERRFAELSERVA